MGLLEMLEILALGGLVACLLERSKRRLQPALSLGAENDEDVKIAGATSGTVQNTSEDLERLAEMVKAEHENGNIERAKRLAVMLVDTVFTHDEFLKDIRNKDLTQQIRILMTFTLDICLENGLPNQITAQTAQNLFYEQIGLRDQAFFDEIQTSGAFSMYLLCARSEIANSFSIGEKFATLCKKEAEEEKDFIALGKNIFEYYLKYCYDRIKEAGFVK